MQITPVPAADNGRLPVLFPCRWSAPGIACETQFVSQPELLPKLDMWNRATRRPAPNLGAAPHFGAASRPLPPCLTSLTKQMAAQACCCQWQDFNTLWLSAMLVSHAQRATGHTLAVI